MKVFIGKTKNKIRFTAFLICAMVAFVCLCLLHETNQTDRGLNAAIRWKSDKQEFSYISVYLLVTILVPIFSPFFFNLIKK